MNATDKLDILAAEFERLLEQSTRPGDVRKIRQMSALVGELRQEFDDLLHQRQELASLYDIARDLAAASDLQDLLSAIVDKAIVLVNAERGYIVLADVSEEAHIAVARRFSEGELAAAKDTFSSSLVRRVMQTREPILTTDVQGDERYELSQSIILQDIRSVLAVPLIARGVLQGAIYVDTRMSVRPFSEADLKLLEAMAGSAALAIRAARLFEEVRQSNEQLQQALADLRSAQNRLIEAERLAAVGRLAASVAHELRNPLTVMRGSLYYLNRLVSMEGIDHSPDILRRHFAKMDAEIDRQAKIINDLLFFSRHRPRQLSSADINAILIETLLRVPMPESVTVLQDLDPELMPIRADADQLQQVFINLVTNAVQAMPEGGMLSVSTRRDGDYIEIRVQDTGIGIAEENLARVFEPFFTTKEKGIGLGLAVSASIIEGHRGTIRVESKVGKGTVFIVRLPMQLIG
ncbi:MAG: GAF domain-containing protein [Chloroflexi bacterium]|nr:GAF domain-containing protein [Chloroflexota bacterium]